MDKIRSIIEKHEILVFFLLAFAITWAVWIPSLLTSYAGVISAWGAFGPALAAIIITRFVSPERRAQKRKAPWVAFLIGLAVSDLVFILLASMRFRPPWSSKIVIGLIFQGLISAIAPAFVISSIFSRNEAVRAILKSLIKPSGSVLYYLFALLIVPVTSWLGSLLTTALGQAAFYVPQPLEGWDGVGFLAIAFISQFFYGNTLGEEVGWRGFALPRLQTRSSPLVASLVLSLFWFAWHLPLKVLNPDPISYLFYGLSFIPQTILLTWLFNRTNGSILAVGIVHALTNVVGKHVIAPSNPWLIVQFIMAAVLILIDRMWDRSTLEHASGDQSLTKGGLSAGAHSS